MSLRWLVQDKVRPCTVRSEYIEYTVCGNKPPENTKQLRQWWWVVWANHCESYIHGTMTHPACQPPVRGQSCSPSCFMYCRVLLHLTHRLEALSWFYSLCFSLSGHTYPKEFAHNRVSMLQQTHFPPCVCFTPWNQRPCTITLWERRHFSKIHSHMTAFLHVLHFLFFMQPDLLLQFTVWEAEKQHGQVSVSQADHTHIDYLPRQALDPL